MAKKINVVKRQEHLPSPTYVRALAEIRNQTARGAAIAGTAYLDLLLRSALEKGMRPNLELQDSLFENRGPLQDFSARIKLAFALQIIGSGAYLDLCTMRDIRNAFAHSIETFDFDREDIAARCRALWYPRKIQFANKPRPEKPREMFVRGVEMIAQGLIEFQLGRRSATFIQMGPPWPEPQQVRPSLQKPRARRFRGDPVPN